MPNGQMNPSTYQQVRENMERLLRLIGDEDPSMSYTDVVNNIEIIKNELDDIKEMLNPDPSTGGASDITTDADGNIRVYGIQIITQNAELNNPPTAYTRDVTFELKSTAAVGLSTIDGFSNRYCIVITYKHNLPSGESVDTFKYVPQQVAFGDNFKTVSRNAQTNNSEWGTWHAITEEYVVKFPVFVDQESEPSDQKAGDYWFKDIENE